MPHIDWSSRLLSVRLGLGDLIAKPPCHAYQNACVCDDCSEREALSSMVIEPTRQPWEPKAA